MLLRDLAYALRVWGRRPGAVAAAITALALGIAATTTVFSVVLGVLIRPLPYAAPDRLVMIWQDMRARGGPEREWASPGAVNDWRERSAVFEDLGAVRGWAPNLTSVAEPERLRGAAVSAGYFAALGVPPALGRTFTEDEDRPGGPAIAVLSYGLWMRRFGGDPSLVGRAITLDGLGTTIVGIMPRSFRPPIVEAEIWSPLRINRAGAPRGMIVLRVLGRLKAGVTLDAAQAEMSTIATGIGAENPEWQGIRISLVPLQEDMVGAVRPLLLVLSGAVGLVLLIACANATSLLLARASERTREIGIRVALGAGRGRIVAQLLAESLLLASAGGLLGVLLAWWGLESLLAIAPPSAPRLQDVRLDLTVIGFAASVTLVSAVVAGLTPALTAARVELAPALRNGTRDGGSRMRSALVVVEVTIVMVLVVGAALLVRSFIALQHVDLGFRTDHLLTASLVPPRGAYRGDEAIRGLFARILERTAAVPGIDAAALASVLPLGGMNSDLSFRIPGRPPARSPADQPTAWFRVVSPDYFATMGVRITQGRNFVNDDRADAPAVVAINESLARKYWPGLNPLGRRVDVEGLEATIVGVVADVRHRGPAEPPDAEMYLPYTQFGARSVFLVVRTSADPAGAASLLRAAVRDVDPNLPLANIATMEQLSGRSIAQPRFIATMLSAFAALAAGLALVGVYSVLSFSVSRRVREIGVRMALGARRVEVIGLVLGESLTLVAAGVLLGGAAAAVLARLLQSLLYGVGPGDPVSFAGMASAILLAALAASYAPARRASLIDPIVALRED